MARTVTVSEDFRGNLAPMCWTARACGDLSFRTVSMRQYGSLLSLRVSEVGRPGSG